MATTTSSRRVPLGAVAFDPPRRVLVDRGAVVALSRLEYALLSLLVERRPRAVSKDEIQEILWPDVAVSETSLTTLVKDLRAKLRQSGREGPIRTVHGYGYALEGAPGAGPAPPRLVRGRTEIPAVSPDLVLGREPGKPGSIDDASVSRRHARLTWNASGLVLEDLGSKNGTYVRGERITGPVALKDGDDVRLGLVTFVFRAAPTGASTTKTVA
ncbi:MAG TPA: FHA domain-containing protein [Thermoanaerobaculia bacterium]|nr:FHA domain-containing protein [Thermoanaerobaculia bacterium]